MNAETIANLILLFAQQLPSLLQLVAETRATMSAEDQATVDAALATLRTDALTHLAQAETDLDAASQS